MTGAVAGTPIVDRYGWRLFAVPVLVVVTVVALLAPGHGHRAARALAADGAGSPGLGGVNALSSSNTGRAVAPRSATAAPRKVWSEAEPTACAHNSKPSYVLVDIDAQHVWMCEGPKQVYTSAATTGATGVGDATPTGTWVVQGRQRDRYLSGADYDVFVKYWIPFNGDIGFHDASWQKMAFGAADYPTLGSHGCVHLPTPVMKWLYGWIQPGRTTVTVQA